MCINCPDWVYYCGQEGCYNIEAGPFGKIKQFYAGDRYCRHLRAKFNKEFAQLGDGED